MSPCNSTPLRSVSLVQKESTIHEKPQDFDLFVVEYAEFGCDEPLYHTLDSFIELVPSHDCCQMIDLDLCPSLFGQDSPILWVSRDGKIYDQSVPSKTASARSSQISRRQLDLLKQMMAGDVARIERTSAGSRLRCVETRKSRWIVSLIIASFYRLSHLLWEAYPLVTSSYSWSLFNFG